MQEDANGGLVKKALSGDGMAFGLLIDPLLEPAYRLAVTMLGDRSEAEDAVQDACLTAWRKLRNVRPGADLRPWFLAVVANRCRTARRTRWWQVLRMPEISGVAGVAARDPETRSDLVAAFDKLAHDQRKVLALFYGLDLTLAEVAAVLGCSEAAAKARLYRAVAALRPGLEVREVGA